MTISRCSVNKGDIIKVRMYSKNYFQLIDRMFVHETNFQVSFVCASMSLISTSISKTILNIDVQLLKKGFINGYCEGDRVLYIFIAGVIFLFLISITDDKGKMKKASCH